MREKSRERTCGGGGDDVRCRCCCSGDAGTVAFIIIIITDLQYIKGCALCDFKGGIMCILLPAPLHEIHL